ncbi:MAG: type II toxin-antitoxin system PemK/MazF family toxin [Armatimonadota bacterium]|nr:type II toxin-antitoxin system PemK/MazF family toxin [Armatimonadota bacterium]
MLAPASLVRSDIVLAAFPFADLSSTKRRPAVIVGVNPSYGEFTLAFVTSQNTAFASPDEVLILPTHPEFSMTGLSVASKVRAGKLVTLTPHLLTRRLGQLGPLLTAGLDRVLIAALHIDLLPFQAESRVREREQLAAVYGSGGLPALFAALSLSPPVS